MINVANHYWIIAGSSTEVYSSASNTLVPVTDATYVAWAASNYTTPIASVAELATVLQDRGSRLPSWLFEASSFIQPAPATYTADQLDAYTVYSRWMKEQSGLTLSSGMPIKTDDRSQAKINGLLISTLGKTNVTTNFHAADDQFYALDEPAIVAVSSELQAFINQCFATSAQTASGIANGSITTLDQIDAAFAAIARGAKK